MANKTRNFELIIYPDSESYNLSDVLREAQNYFINYAWILHDKDNLEDGTPKKPHIHFYGNKKNATSSEAVSKVTGVPISNINHVKSWNGAIRYLTHIDYSDKYQYNIDDISTNIKDLDRYFQNIDEGEIVVELLELKLKGKSYKEVLYYAVKKGYYSEFRRNVGVIDLIMKEEKEMENKHNDSRQ